MCVSVCVSSVGSFKSGSSGYSEPESASSAPAFLTERSYEDSLVGSQTSSVSTFKPRLKRRTGVRRLSGEQQPFTPLGIVRDRSKIKPTGETPILPQKKTKPVSTDNDDEVEGTVAFEQPSAVSIASAPMDIVAAPGHSQSKPQITASVSNMAVESVLRNIPSDYYTDDSQPIAKPSPKPARRHKVRMDIDDDTSRTSHSSTEVSSRTTRPGASLSGTSRSEQPASSKRPHLEIPDSQALSLVVLIVPILLRH